MFYVFVSAGNRCLTVKKKMIKKFNLIKFERETNDIVPKNCCWRKLASGPQSKCEENHVIWKNWRKVRPHQNLAGKLILAKLYVGQVSNK